MAEAEAEVEVEATIGISLRTSSISASEKRQRSIDRYSLMSGPKACTSVRLQCLKYLARAGRDARCQLVPGKGTTSTG